MTATAQRPDRYRDYAHGYAAMCQHFFPRPPHKSGLPAPSWGPLEETRQGVLDYVDGGLAWLAANGRSQ